MKKFSLKAEEMKTRENADSHLKMVFGITDSNQLTLDSIYMEIMSLKGQVTIVLDDASEVVENLGRFGLGLIKLFRDAASESDNIDFQW
ncbi:MAG: hypothetical protein IKV96_00990 [Firmicutes bacterium]|nr:hypothetical protein [Bacillota bacterium]